MAKPSQGQGTLQNPFLWDSGCRCSRRPNGLGLGLQDQSLLAYSQGWHWYLLILSFRCSLELCTLLLRDPAGALPRSFVYHKSRCVNRHDLTNPTNRFNSYISTLWLKAQCKGVVKRWKLVLRLYDGYRNLLRMCLTPFGSLKALIVPPKPNHRQQRPLKLCTSHHEQPFTLHQNLWKATASRTSILCPRSALAWILCYLTHWQSFYLLGFLEDLW